MFYGDSGYNSKKIGEKGISDNVGSDYIDFPLSQCYRHRTITQISTEQPSVVNNHFRLSKWIIFQQ